MSESTMGQIVLAQSDFSQALVLLVVGVSIVFGALIGLGLVVALMSRLGREREAPVQVSEPARTPVEGGRIDPRHVVVISAAVAAAVCRPARVHRIVMLGREAGKPWVTEGRVVVMGSHHPHRK